MTLPHYINPRIAKEIRMLLPAFGLTLLGSLLVCPLLGRDAESWSMMLFAFGCVFMSVEAFGNDVQQGTLPLLLSQPLPRSLVWREKMLVLGIALGLVAIAVATSISSSSLAILAVPLCTFLTAPFWTLLSRHTLGAIVLTVAVPGFLLGMISIVHDYYGLSRPTGEVSAVVVLAVFSLACYWTGYRRFQKLEVVGSSFVTRELAVPQLLGDWFFRPFAKISDHLSGSVGALVKKELRLQQTTFIAALLFCVVAASGAIAHLSGVTLSSDFKLSELIWSLDFYLYVAVVPLLAGAVAVAEEKTWGVTEWQMTLPPLILQQWLVKMVVALSTSLALGLIIPVIALFLGARLVGDADNWLPMHVLAPLIMANLLLTSVALYAASMCRTSARAFILAVAMIVVGVIAISMALKFVNEHRDLILRILQALWPLKAQSANLDWQIPCATVFVLACLSLRFAYTAYREQLTVRRRVLQCLALVLAGCLASIFNSFAPS